MACCLGSEDASSLAMIEEEVRTAYQGEKSFKDMLRKVIVKSALKVNEEELGEEDILYCEEEIMKNKGVEDLYGSKKKEMEEEEPPL